MSTPACANGPRHTWVWVRNVTQTTATTRSVRLSLKGRYRYACGATKLGRPNHNGPDLRGITGDAVFMAGATKKVTP